MQRNAYGVCLVVLSLAGLSGCSSGSEEPKKAAYPKERIQGKAQIVLGETSSTDVALNAGGQSVYIWEGARRYRLFLRTPYEFEGGKQYVIEGYNAQKIIDDIGDPNQGKQGYPLDSSCARAVKTAWPGLAFDVTDGYAATLRARVKRYPARQVILVTGVAPFEETTADAKKPSAAAKTAIPEIDVPGDKQKALLAEGQLNQPAPLWEPAGGPTRCKVLIGADGKIEELETGAQLCESVDWAKFRFQPTLKAGKPAKVRTEIEIAFQPRTTT